jgi:phosphohistidine phosphatase
MASGDARMLYLVQHGEAAKETEDPARPLTGLGRQEVARVARAAARLGLEVTVIAHSGKLRAKQTAEILAAELRPTPSVIERSGLGPNENPRHTEDFVAQASAPTMLVGHLPHLSRLASLLLAGDPAKEIIAFRMGGIVCLSERERQWRLQWILTPEIASSEG